MNHALCLIHDMQDIPPAHRQRVGNQIAVALPREPFRTHQREMATSGHGNHARKRSLKGLGGCVIGIAPERILAPGSVRRIRPRTPASAQILLPDLLDLRVSKRLLQRGSCEMGVTTRAGMPANVDKQGNAVRAQ